MDAAVWTAIGLLAATSLGSLFYLGARIDALSARIDVQGTAITHRIDTQGEALTQRIDALGARLDARMSAIEQRVDAHLDRHASA